MATSEDGEAGEGSATDEKKEASSGGVLARNAREGFRSETLAQFALSAFGPASSVETWNDHGVDLVCATATPRGQRLHVGASYLVQVKSDSIAEVTFKGEHAHDWLEGLGSPLLICRVEKSTTRIRLYSTWSMARVLLQARSDGARHESFTLVMDEPVTTEQPQAACIPLGPPIVDFKLTELANVDLLNGLRACVEDWVTLDVENIVRRRTGLAIAKGYTRWTTNCRPSMEADWYKPYFYSEANAAHARKLIAECATLIALLPAGEERTLLAAYVGKYCLADLDEWSRGRLGI